MNKRLEQMLKGIREEATLAASDYSIEEQDAFFAELAEWATTQREMLSMTADLKLQDYDN